DTVRITQNGSSLEGRKLRNGQRLTAEGFTEAGDIRLVNHSDPSGSYTVSKDFYNLGHGFAGTSHSSQGRTVDTVLVAQSSQSFGKASNRNQFYVSVSRGRGQVKIYTDDQKELFRQVIKASERQSAIELMHRENFFY